MYKLLIALSLFSTSALAGFQYHGETDTLAPSVKAESFEGETHMTIVCSSVFLQTFEYIHDFEARVDYMTNGTLVSNTWMVSRNSRPIASGELAVQLIQDMLESDEIIIRVHNQDASVYRTEGLKEAMEELACG